MSRAERNRTTTTVGVADASVSQVQATGLLRLSYRQAKRIWRRDEDGGDAGLMEPWRGKPATLRTQGLGRCAQDCYADSDPTLPARGLAKEGPVVDHDTSHCLTAGAGPPTTDAPTAQRRLASEPGLGGRAPYSFRPAGAIDGSAVLARITPRLNHSGGGLCSTPRPAQKHSNSLVVSHLAAIFATICLLGPAPAKATVTNVLAYAPSSPGNPLKGLVPFSNTPTSALNYFPHSMMCTYIPLSSLMAGPTNFNWAALEQQIHAATNDGSHLIFRVYLDYPGLPTGIPFFLLQGGLTTYAYTNNGGGLCPNYEDPHLQSALTSFIAAMGARYDNDPRIAWIQAGLLGWWGEWHTGGAVSTHWASLATQRTVLHAYMAAFPNTKIEVRYPTGTNGLTSGTLEFENDNLPFGYHDDYFLNMTLGAGSWFTMSEERAAGSLALNKWQQFPCGGEIDPAQVATCWFTPPVVMGAQTFANCVAATHSTWMGDWPVFFNGVITNAAYTNAIAGARLLGYEFHATSTTSWTSNSVLWAGVTITNTGVAPFYYSWPIQFGAADDSGHILATWSTSYTVAGLLPGAAPLQVALPLAGAPGGSFELLMRVVNPLPNGRPLRFANTTQDATVNGWLTLGTIP